MIEPLWKSLDGIEQLCKVGLEDIQTTFDIKENLWEKFVEKEIKLNKDLMKLIWKRQDDFDWTKETPLGGAGTSLNGIALYCLVRYSGMSFVIETGVSGGYYTSFLLAALTKNNTYPILKSLELSDDLNEVGKLIPENIKKEYLESGENDWHLLLGQSSLVHFYQMGEHNADLYCHDSLHTMSHMLKELDQFKKTTSETFFVFIDDEKSDNFWERCLQTGAFKKPGYDFKYISGKESRLKGHLGGFLYYKKREIIK
jgi:hypothetical protein